MYNEPYNQCVECEQVITNPLCPSCLTTQMCVMFGEHDEKLSDVVSVCSIEGSTRCIKCNSGMGLCAHCFCRDVYEFLDEQKHPLAKEFLARFDFDLRRDFL